jgi:hypothetical protein
MRWLIIIRRTYVQALMIAMLLILHMQLGGECSKSVSKSLKNGSATARKIILPHDVIFDCYQSIGIQTILLPSVVVLHSYWCTEQY